MSSRTGRMIRADFFTVEAEGCDFKTLLEAVSSRTGTDLNYTVSSGDPIRLKELGREEIGEGTAEKRTLFLGDMAKIRMNNLPTRIGRSGKEREIDFLKDEGVGEETAFLYDPERNALALQRNRNGVSFTAFSEYFSSFAGGNASVRLFPMISQTALERLRRSPRVKRFELEVQPVAARAALRGSRSLGKAISFMEHLAGEKIGISVGLARGSCGGLSRDKILGVVSDLIKNLGLMPNELRRLRALAEDEDSRTAELDLLVDRIQAYDILPFDESRRISLKARTNFLKTQWLLLDSRLTSERRGADPAS